MINNFKCKDTEKIFRGHPTRKFPSSIVKSAQKKLKMLNNSCGIDDLKIPPANHLERLKATRLGH